MNRDVADRFRSLAGADPEASLAAAAAASPRLRALLEPVATTGAGYQQ